MSWIYWTAGIYAVGFVVTAFLVLMTGGEKHIADKEWWWVWFNIAIWPVWWAIFGTAALIGKLSIRNP